MTKESVTHVSSAAFAKDPQRYLDEVQPGHVFEVNSTGPRTETLVIILERGP